MAASADIGVIGLGVMGRNLALNIADRGFTVAVYNRTVATTRALAAAAQDKQLVPCETPAALVAAIRPPRPVLLMVKAGDAVDAQIDALQPLLATGDMVIDGGNSNYADTMRRERAAAGHGLGFLGAGISGGEAGARHGPSIMVGGTASAYARVQPMLEAIAARIDDAPCCARLGPDGAGHFVKMLHNGIEYADMQLIAEVYALLRGPGGMAPAELQATFAAWNEGELDSYLVEITAAILGTDDPETKRPLVDVILDRAGEKGTGRWASVAALDLGVPAPTIAAAVFARALSALKPERVAAAPLFAREAAPFAGDRSRLAATLHDALLAAKLSAYAQGFAVIAGASRAHDWSIDGAEVARIWRGGCIIRARFLDRVAAAFRGEPTRANLLLDPYFRDRMTAAEGALREAVGLAAAHGVPVPALASALAYFDGYRSAQLPANLIQAQRDYFGAHTFERTDRPGAFHFDWPAS